VLMTTTMMSVDQTNVFLFYAQLNISDFWPIVLSVEPMVQCVVFCLSSVTFCIVAKRCVLAKKVSEGVNRKPGSNSSFLGSPPYFYFQFRRYGPLDGRFCLMYCGETVRPSKKVSEGVNRKPGSKN